MTDKVRLGIIGLGAQGSMYAQFITDGMVPNMVIGAICDPNPAKADTVASTYPGVPFYTDYIELLESGDVDAVVTCVPHYLHPEMGIAALQRGVHALVEKPAGVYTEQVRELNAFAATKPELTFAIMFNQRNNPLYRRIKEIVDAGEIGAIRRTNWIITTWWRPQGYYDQSAWRATWGGEGGGVLVNQAPHQLDLLAVDLRHPQVGVRQGRVRLPPQHRRRGRGDRGQSTTATVRPGCSSPLSHDLVGTDRFEILGDQGKIVVENSKTATVTRLHKPERELSDGMGMEDVRRLFTGQLNTDDYYSSEVIEFESAWGSQHAGVLENFAANILDGTPLIAPGSDGINGVRLANAIHLSSWTGQEVPLDLDEDLYLSELNQRIRDEGKFAERVRQTP